MERIFSSKAKIHNFIKHVKATQVKRGLKRALTLLLAFLFMLSTVAMAVPDANGYIDDGASQSVASHEQIISVPAHGGDGFISDDNGSIKFYVNRSTGGFYILPSGVELDESKPPSFGSFRIDGEEFVFGGNYPGAFFVMSPMINHGGTAQAVWYKNGLYISQYLNIVQNEVRANSYAVYIRYEIESAYYGETFNGNVEGRILIDTMFGAYDNLPVKISGGEALTYETVFDEPNMPAYFGNDTSSGAYPRVYGLLIDSSVTRPSSLTFADLDNVSGTVFDYNPNTSQVITDSAVLLYFEGQRDSDGSVFFSTIYGFDVEKVENPYNMEDVDYVIYAEVSAASGFLHDRTLSLYTVIKVSAINHTALIKDDGSLWTWGSNSSGQLGLGDTINRNIPTQVGNDTNWAYVSVGENSTTAIKNDGSLWAWGANGGGGSPLGLGDDINRHVPTRVGSDYNWASISSWSMRTVATRSDGSLWVWGGGTLGQLGLGDTIISRTPTQIGNDKDWMSVSAGRYHTVAIRNDGSLWAWGLNNRGQLGLGDTINRNIPTQVGNGTNWAYVSSGLQRTMAIRTDGSLWAWGDNTSGGLGLSDTIDRLTPTQVENGKDWVSVSTGRNHTVATRSDGSLWAWGSNSNGTLGIGTSTGYYYMPIQVGSDTNWLSVSAGNFHTVAIRNDGILWAWGFNAGGQLGLGDTTTFRSIPTLITPLPVTFELSSGNIGGSIANVQHLIPRGLSIGIANVPTPTRTNFIFGGWRENDTGAIITHEAVAALAVTASRSFTAVWTPYVYGLTVGTGFLVPPDEMSSDMVSLTEGAISFLITPDPTTFYNGNPTRIVEGVFLRDGSGTDIPFTATPSADGTIVISFAFVPQREVHFELISTSAYNLRTVEVTSHLLDYFYVEFFDRTVNPDALFPITRTAIASGRDITVALTTHTGAEVPGSVRLVGQNTSINHTITDVMQESDGFRTVYFFEFTMPNENAILDADVMTDPHHRFQIIPVTGANGTLNIRSSATDSVQPIDERTYGAWANHEIIVEFDYDYIHFELHGLSVINVFTGEEYQLTQHGVRQYRFIMPSAPVYVFLDVRQRPIFQIETQINHGGVINLTNIRNGLSSFNAVEGYERDRVEFGITNTDPRRIIQTVELINAETRTVVESLFDASENRFAIHFSGVFEIPAHDVVLRVILTNAPLLSVTVDPDLPAVTTITPRATSVAFGDVVEFDFASNDTRHLLYRPVMRAFDESGTLLFEQFFQDDSTLRRGHPVAFTSALIQRADNIPFRIELGVYEINREFVRQLVSITPNSERAMLFTHIYVHGHNMYEGDYGVVQIGTAPSSLQVAPVITYIDATTLVIPIPEDMRPTDTDVTFYVRIHDEVRSFTIYGARELRVAPFGVLGIVSDVSNNHSVVMADNVAELGQLADGRNKILRLVGNVRYNPTAGSSATRVYEFTEGQVLIGNVVSYTINPNTPLRVYQRTNGVDIIGSGGSMSIPNLNVFHNEPISINLRNGIRYIDTWASVRNANHNLVLANPGVENITIRRSGFAIDPMFLDNGFSASISDVILLRDSVIFGGHLYFGFNFIHGVDMELLNINLYRLEYGPGAGLFGLRGIEARGNIDIGEGGSIMGIQGLSLRNTPGVGVTADVNTFSGYMYFDARLDVVFFAADGRLEFAPVRGIPIPDNFRLRASIPSPGIPIIPPAPVGFITQLGGGFSNLAQSFNGNFDIIPSLRFNAYGALSLVDLIRISDLRLSKGLGFPLFPNLEVTGRAGIGVPGVPINFHIIRDFSASLGIGPTGYGDGVRLAADVHMNVLDIIEGRGNFHVSYTIPWQIPGTGRPPVQGGFRFSGTLHASVGIPEIRSPIYVWIPGRKIGCRIWGLPRGSCIIANCVPTFSPGRWERPVIIPRTTLLGQNFDIGLTSIGAGVTVWPFGDINVRHYWGASGVSFIPFSLNNSLETHQAVYDDNEELIGHVSIGSNLSVVATSGASGMSMFSAMVGTQADAINIRLGQTTINDEETGESYTFEDPRVHILTFPADIASHNSSYTLVLTAPRGDIQIMQPSGRPYALRFAETNDTNVPGFNALAVNNEDGETPDILLISLPKIPGEWVISSSDAFASTIVETEPLPMIDSVSFDGNSQITWSLSNLNLDCYVYVLEVRMSTDDGSDIANISPGIRMDDILITSGTNGTHSGVYELFIDSMANFESGNYYPRLVLLEIPRQEFIGAGYSITDDMTMVPVSSMNATTSRQHNNANTPASVNANTIEVSPGGNGALRVQWQQNNSGRIADGYILKIFGGAGNPIFYESTGEENEILTQVSWNIPRERGENGRFDVLLGGLPTGASYYAEIVPYASVSFNIGGEDFERLVIGVPTPSAVVNLPVPDFPVIHLQLPGSAEAIFNNLGTRIVPVSACFDFNIASTNTDAIFTVMQDGVEIPVSRVSQREASINVEMIGLDTSRLEIIATSSTGDTSFANFTVYLDDIPPPLFVTTGADGQIYAASNGNYIIMGHSEVGATIRDDLGNMTTANSNGEFVLTGVLPDGEDSTYRTVTALDIARNSTSVDVIILSSDNDWEPPINQQPPDNNQPPPGNNESPPVGDGEQENQQTPDNNQPPSTNNQQPAQDVQPPPRTGQQTTPSALGEQPDSESEQQPDDEQEPDDAYIAVHDPIEPTAPGYIQPDVAMQPALMLIDDLIPEHANRGQLLIAAILMGTAAVVLTLTFTHKKWMKLFKRRE